MTFGVINSALDFNTYHFEMQVVKKWEKCFIKKHKFSWKINYMFCFFFTELHLLAARILELHFCNHIISNFVDFYKHLEHKH